jgi:16S rRNA processing protein RimM
MTSDPGELVAVGRIGRAHGLRGEVSVIPWTDTPDERFVVGVTLVVGDGKGGVLPDAPTLVIETARVHSGRWLLGFHDVVDRNGAEALQGRTLMLPAVARPAIADPDEFYDSDLVGLTARTSDGTELGRVTDVVHGPVGDYLVLSVAGDANTGDENSGNAGATAREHLVPFVSAIVPVVDVAGGTITVDPPEGLFEL